MKLSISTRISDFEQLRRSGMLYVDKTVYIWKLINEGDGFFFLSRPRRYGKSLLCSTLECLFKGRRDLFEGLYIAEHTDYDFKPCPVIHLNFSLLNTLDYESFVRGFQFLLRQQAVQNGVDLSRDDLPSYMMMELLNALDEPCAIIIDEFDTPVTDCIFDHEKMLRIREAFSSFYSVIKNMGNKVRFLFMTGITKFSNLSIFSKFNNLTDISMREEFSCFLGYTHIELEDNFGEYVDDYLAQEDCPYAGRSDFFAALADYYDGYHFSPYGGESVFNPVSIGYFFTNSCRFENYWDETAVSTLAVQLARQVDLLGIVDDMPMVGLSNFTTFDIGELADMSINAAKVYVLLYYTGYLTIRKCEGKVLHLSFPNKEVASSFTTALVSRYVDKDADMPLLADMGREAINSGNGQALVSALNNYLEQFPYDVLGRKEKDFHLALHAFFVSSGFETESEEHSLNGRADLVVKAGSVVYIIELKVDMSAECALSQIEEQGYYKKHLLHASAKNLEIHLMGLSISSKSRNIVDYREKLITGGV